MDDRGGVEPGRRVEVRRSVPQEWCGHNWDGQGCALQRKMKRCIYSNGGVLSSLSRGV